VNKMQTSQRGINLIKSFESFRSNPYLDAVGIPTIGYGSTRGVTMDMDPITESQATQMLMDDLGSFENVINNYVIQPLNQNQFDALASFVYNCGPGNFENSTMLTMLNNADYDSAAEQFLRWDRAGGQVIQGLLNRRQTERNLFLSIV